LHSLLQQRLQQVQREAKRFARHSGQADPEVLHDLRVAMRRLLSLYQAFAPAIAPQDPNPVLLRNLFRQTNPARDREVALALLERLDPPLPWLTAQWQEERHQATTALQHLPVELSALTPPQLDTDHPAIPLGELAATQLAPQLKRFRRQAKKLRKHWHIARAHQLRIRIKKLRYLLEPFTRQHRPCARAVGQLKRFQDHLGDYHDIQLLRERLKAIRRNTSDPAPRRQLKQARRQLRNVQKTLRRTIRDDLGQTRKVLLGTLKTAAASLETSQTASRQTVVII
jgi:CHAD domain-containing protein